MSRKSKKRIKLNVAEIQGQLTRVHWAEKLISQLPSNHEGAQSWLLNYGIEKDAILLRKMTGLKFDKKTQSALLNSKDEQAFLHITKIPILTAFESMSGMERVQFLKSVFGNEYTDEQREQIASVLKDELSHCISQNNTQSDSKSYPTPDDLLYDSLTQGGEKNLSLTELLIVQDFHNHINGTRKNDTGNLINEYYAKRWHSKDFSK